MKIKVETEKKYYCMEPEKLITIAERYSFKLEKRLIEIDEYFTDIDSSFIKNRTCLRIRKHNDEYMEITYKGKSNSLLGLYCKLENNIEAKISEYNNYLNLFTSLGYYSYVEVKKERVIYTLNMNKYKYSIMIDKLPEIGGFVEFEIISEAEDSKKNELQEKLNNFVLKFKSLKLTEANEPYRDIVAKHIYSKKIYNKQKNKLYINIDSELSKIEKDFFKKYKNKISSKMKNKVKWNEYKKNPLVEDVVVNILPEYMENLVFDSKEVLVTFELLKKLNMNTTIITKVNKVFFDFFLKKIEINVRNAIYINENNIKNELSKNNIVPQKMLIINEKNLKDINSILLIMINNE